MTDAEVLALHREVVSIPSPSGQEAALCDHLAGWLGARGVEAGRVGDSLWAVFGQGPTLCLNTHIDTVPPAPGWTFPPLQATVRDGRVYGLGASDAKASVAAMVAAFLRLAAEPPRSGGPEGDLRVVLTLAAGEETRGQGTESLVAALARAGIRPDAVVVGEPTGLDVVIAQKGLMVLELRAVGRACHAAHGRALGAPNAIARLARDLCAIESVDLGPPDALLGPVTVEPTVLSGGTARNMVPAEAACVLDVRTNPAPGPEEVLGRLRAAVDGEVRVLSDRLRPCATDAGSAIVRAARRASPGARIVGSRAMSDWVWFAPTPAIKAGPGDTARSHAPDEYATEEEVIAGARFYEATARAFAREAVCPPDAWRS